MAFTVAISNEKGGVAKTTSTLSLGAALAELNHRVLLIDLDPLCHNPWSVSSPALTNPPCPAILSDVGIDFYGAKP